MNLTIFELNFYMLFWSLKPMMTYEFPEHGMDWTPIRIEHNREMWWGIYRV